ncbi:cupin domain-containing protein [Achromobacter insolitus]|uniref:cupin domain-containing protein n=1 Tax=Achromobacter insolitus TaxID=217204 RepID=UPI00174CCFB6|nr:cupin domain-containing protein [Achromobacter insolitus]
MLVNADFSRLAIVAPDQYFWVTSPQSGVERVMLDRMGGEKARVTSIVRYAPDSHFPHHIHPGGEEIFVLSGTFSDDDANYPSGWYLRNPPGSSHRPFTDAGAIIFVKLWQMPAGEDRRIRIDTGSPDNWTGPQGQESCMLFASEHEQVRLKRFSPQQSIVSAEAGGSELLVLAGEVMLDGSSYQRGTWMRLPAGDALDLASGPRGATLYLKAGRFINTQPEA